MYQLEQDDIGWMLKSNNPKEHPVRVDFTDKQLNYRRQKLLLSKDGLVKAIHKPNTVLKILDLTAGMGEDSFLLASLGHTLTMLERNPTVATLLRDGLARSAKTSNQSITARMQLIEIEALTYLQSAQAYDVIYADPMFPQSKKSRLVGKNMRALQAVAGLDQSEHDLVEAAINAKPGKVVVKRPIAAEALFKTPSFCYKFPTCRFDVYIP